MSLYRCIVCRAEIETSDPSSRCRSCGAGKGTLKLVRSGPQPTPRAVARRPSIPVLLRSLEDALEAARAKLPK